jgi:hypothetical protein
MFSILRNSKLGGIFAAYAANRRCFSCAGIKFIYIDSLAFAAGIGTNKQVIILAKKSGRKEYGSNQADQSHKMFLNN